MIYPKCCLCTSIIKNHVTVKAINTPPYKSTCSTILIQPLPICLVFTQHSKMIGNILVYYIYIINNFKCDIENIKLKDILPRGVKFISTSVEHGEYKRCNKQIFYNIDVIEKHSFCRIILNLRPITLGKKINSIEIMCKRPKLVKCIVNENPCKSCYIV
jgi:conserved repeat domain